MDRISDITLASEAAIITIQSMWRCALTRRVIALLRSKMRREKIKKNFEDPSQLFRFYFLQSGAVVRIQRWFRALPWRRKVIWRKKFKKFLSRVHERRLMFQAIKKNGYSRLRSVYRSKEDWREYFGMLGYDEVSKRFRSLISGMSVYGETFAFDISTVLCRVIRGFLGRCKFNKIKKAIQSDQNRRKISAIVIQSLIRGALVRIRLPQFTFRRRALLMKIEKWKSKRFMPNINSWDSFNLPCSKDYFYRRRNSISFSNLKIQNLKLFGPSSIIIQKYWRRFRAIKRIYMMKTSYIHVAATRIQHWFRTWIFRMIRNRHARRIQRWIRRYLRNKAFIHGKARTIQRVWRTYSRRIHQFAVFQIRGISRRKLQQWFRIRLAKRRFANRLERKRYFHEMHVAGEVCYNLSLTFQFYEQLWNGIQQFKKLNIPRELQQHFLVYSPQNTLELSKLNKMLKECPNLLGSDITLKVVELEFTKAKSITEKRLDFPRYVDFLKSLAIIRYGGFRKQGMENKKSSGGEGMENKEESDSSGFTASDIKDFVDSFRYGRLQGTAALVTKLVVEYYLPSDSFRSVVAQLGDQAAWIRARDLLDENIIQLQRFARNRMGRYHLAQDLQRLRKQRRLDYLNANALILQCFIRRMLSKIRMRRRAQIVYSKFLDLESQQEYWTNSRTGRSFWTKPVPFGLYYDCGVAVRVPPPEEQILPYCFSCQVETARFYCLECDQSQCPRCVSVNHRRGNRRDHQQIALEMCVQCEFQGGSKYCPSCQDYFCDSCFSFVHNRGRLRLHWPERILAACHHCADRSAMWSYQDPYTGLTQALCTVCHTALHGNPQQTKQTTQPLKYQGKKVQDFLRKKEQEEKELQIQEDFIQRKMHQHQIKLQKAVALIQRVIRGFLARRRIRSMIHTRKEWCNHRLSDDEIRKTQAYQWKKYFGKTPKLTTDTTRERVFGQFPVWLHPLVEEVFDGDWKHVYELQRKNDSHAELMSHASLLDRMFLKSRLKHVEQDLKSASMKVDAAKQKLSLARAAYRDAKNSKRSSEEARQKLYNDIEKLDKEYQACIAVRDKLQESLKAVEQQVNDMLGPLPMPSYFRQCRLQGRKLPFSVDVYKNCGAVLTRWIKNRPKMEEKEAVVDESQSPSKSKSTSNPPASMTPTKEVEKDKKKKTNKGENSKPEKIETTEEDCLEEDLEVEDDKWKEFLTPFDTLIINGISFGILPFSSRVTFDTTNAFDSLSSSIGDDDGSASYQSQSQSIKSLEDSVETLDLAKEMEELLKKALQEKAREEKRKKLETAAKEKAKKEAEDLANRSAKMSAASVSPVKSPVKGTEKNGNVTNGDAVKSGEANENADQLLDHSDDEDEEDEEDELNELQMFEHGDYLKNTRSIQLTPKHINLDHPWLLEDANNVPIYKAYSPIPFYSPFISISNLFLHAYPVQKFIAIYAINLHKIAQFYRWMSSLFDEDSDSLQSMLETAMKWERKRDQWIILSNSVVEMSYDFTLRRQVGAIAFQFGRFFGRRFGKLFAKLKKSAKTAAADPISEADEAYLRWEQSRSKEELQVLLDINPPANPINIGSIQIDFEAPCDILRLYLQRYLRDALNETIGDAFCIEKVDATGKVQMLFRKKEFQEYTKTFVDFKMNMKTMEGIHTVRLVKEPGSPPLIKIPEYIPPAIDE